jgi:hypothetical protein
LAATDSPAGGEIDFVEGVHTDVFNTMTLHTNPGCTIDTSRANPDKGLPVSANTFTGTVETSDCNAQANNSNTGCSIQDTDGRSFGSGLNDQQGGVYATLWDDTGVRICTSNLFSDVGTQGLISTSAVCEGFFPRDSIPQDIANSSPNPSSWPAPQAFFSAATCPPDQFFKSHALVIDTTLCGDLASATYGRAGCPGTCTDQVANPAKFDSRFNLYWFSVLVLTFSVSLDAYWNINYVKAFQAA